MVIPSKEQVDDLMTASHEELMTLLGLTALPFLKQPNEILELGRRGAFGSSSTALGAAYESNDLVRVADSFLTRWKAEIDDAICGNNRLLARERRSALSELHVL